MFHVEHSRLACLRNAGRERPRPRGAGRGRSPRPPGRVCPLPAFLKFPRSPGAGTPAPPAPIVRYAPPGSPRATALRAFAPSLLARSLLAPCSLLACPAGRAVPARLGAPFGAEKGGRFDRFALLLAFALFSLFLKVNTILL